MHGVVPCRHGEKSANSGRSGRGKFSRASASDSRAMNPAFIGPPADLIPFLFVEDETASDCWKALVS